MPQEEWKRKCQKQPIQHPKQGHEHLPGPSKETPKTSTQPIKKEKCENLTLFNWMTVYIYVDTLPQPINQGEVVRYFATRPEGIIVHPVHAVMQTTAVPRDGSLCVAKSKCIVMQMTTCCHKTRCGSGIVAVGSANGSEGRGCQ
jgi:hypothetical protein